MGTVNNTVDTVNAAASAIVYAESRIQPTTTVPKKRWGSCWSLYWCFGPHKNSKRVDNAVLVPEPVEPIGPVGSHPATAAPNPSTAIVMPFIVPPSSPASFLQSDPPSATQSPVGLFSLSSLTVNASGGPASIFAIGPYVYETQLVSPPVFSTFTTEPSTAPFTPPPESVQLTTPSSPEVPFAQLLASSLDRNCKNNGTNQRFALSNYEFQPYQQYPGSPGTQLVSPRSIISTSGSSTPFPDRHSVLEFHKGEAPKLLGFENFLTHKWNSNSRLGSGSLTPDSAGQGSRLGSGSLTPDAVKLASQLGSGCLTHDGLCQDSRLGSESLTPDVVAPTARNDIDIGKQISEVTSIVNSENECQPKAALVDHRVSFELTGVDVPRCLANKSGYSLLGNVSGSSQGTLVEDPVDREKIQKNSNSSCAFCSRKTSNASNNKPCNSPGEGAEQCCRKHHSFNSSKEFNFDNRKGVVSDTPANSSNWWTNKKIVGKEGRSSNSWTFFPVLQSEII